MKIFGLTRIRNESLIIKDTLDHLAGFCDAVFVYDDASEDGTFEICKNHKIVKDILRNNEWKEDRLVEEYSNRQDLLNLARLHASTDDWFVYIDADERIDFDWSLLNKTKSNAVRMKLFDFYITHEDVDKGYNERKWLGPEYRKIVIAFKNSPELIYKTLDQREVILPKKKKILDSGYVKHYGKAISIDVWEQTCDYYIEYFDKYADKWKARKGKAIHEKSDFSNDLIQWHEKESKGFQLVDISTQKKSSMIVRLIKRIFKSK